MNTDTADMLATLNRLMPDPEPAISPHDQHVAGIRRSLADAGKDAAALADAIRRCDQDIAAVQDAEAELARLEATLAEAHAAAYLAGRTADVRKIESAIAAQEQRLRPLKAKAAGASAARVELVSRQVAQQQLVGRLQHALALTGAEGLDAYRAASAVHNQQVRQNAIAHRQAVAEEQAAARRRADEERRRRQNTTKEHGYQDDGLPAFMRDPSFGSGGK